MITQQDKYDSAITRAMGFAKMALMSADSPQMVIQFERQASIFQAIADDYATDKGADT